MRRNILSHSGAWLYGNGMAKPDAQPDLLLGRGYTGHEHLPWFGLLNMNARLYDPATGRFLSPDPLVQAPDNTQNYNRYSYCLNNPLKFVDENGQMWVMAYYRGEYFFFYDDRVNNSQDLNYYYNNSYSVQPLEGDLNVYIVDAKTKQIDHSFTLYASGYFTLDGERQYKEFNQHGLIHIGTSDITPRHDGVNNVEYNWHGFYLGNRNPLTSEKQGKKYSYAIPPIDYTDYSAFNHDNNYDNLNAEGITGVMSMRTRYADLQLAYDIARNPDKTPWSFMTFLGFGTVTIHRFRKISSSPLCIEDAERVEDPILFKRPCKCIEDARSLVLRLDLPSASQRNFNQLNTCCLDEKVPLRGTFVLLCVDQAARTFGPLAWSFEQIASSKHFCVSDAIGEQSYLGH